MYRTRIGLFSLLCVFSFIQGACIAHPVQHEDAISAAEHLSSAFEDVATKISPSVVTIKSTKEVEIRGWNQGSRGFSRDMFRNSPFEDFFGPFEFENQEQPARRQVQQGLGSGLIISDDGYILTNSHVVYGADELMVVLSDGTEYKATVIGADPQTDIAVVKIDADNLVGAVLGDSDKIRVGQWVIAAGNPFGLSSTITTGIVSAKGRSGVGITAYEDFIQTDAAINRGNSGGPLVNLRGEVIGINTAMLGYAGNIGIGFSIPINMVKEISEELMTEGRIVRGYLGVMIRDLSEAMSKELEYSSTDGVLITGLLDDGPAAKGGILVHDIITNFNGKEITDMVKLRMDIAEIEPETSVDLTVFREGKSIHLKVTIMEMPTTT